MLRDEEIADLLKETVIVHKGPTFKPRGLHNSGNWCYVNAVLQVHMGAICMGTYITSCALQALVACPPFFNLMREFTAFSHRRLTCTPILDALSTFVSEFSVDRQGKSRDTFPRSINELAVIQN